MIGRLIDSFIHSLRGEQVHLTTCCEHAESDVVMLVWLMIDSFIRLLPPRQ